MSESHAGAPALPKAIVRPSPAGGRRILFAGLVIATIVAVMWLMGIALAENGLDALDIVLLCLFLVTLPWTVIGFWNAAIGFAVLRFADDPSVAVTPAAARVRGNEPITASVALLACIRNEDPERVIRNLSPMLEGLAPFGEYFHLYLLSDTPDGAAAAAEEASYAALAAIWRDRIAVTYRRRSDNAGFKAGNIRDFCLRWGGQHDFAVTLDADSFIPASAILRMVRIMQVSPEIGILQGLVIGMPSTSAFARLFQFGMRLAMWSYTIGSAWWQADCGPHWGHNSVLRLKPFTAHCHIPPLPEGAVLAGRLGGHVLSHDQIEAVTMRRAGYEVRVLPEEQLGWEENPPTLLEFIRRDIRWCQGNMQYWHFLTLPGLKFVSRYQLGLAILMFLGSPAWMALLVLSTIGVVRAERPSAFIAPHAGLAVLAIFLVMWFAPRIATVIDALMRPPTRARFGGAPRFLVNVFTEAVFCLLLLPITWFAHSVFMASLIFGGSVGWGGQARDDHAVPVRDAVAALWPQTVLGCACLAALAVAAPAAIPYALLIAGGLALAVPLCIFTASPAVGAALTRAGIARLPEETAPSPLDALGLKALAGRRSSPSPLAGEGRGGGSGGYGNEMPDLTTPTPDPSPQGGGETTWLDGLQTARGVARSLSIYYRGRRRRQALDHHYARFVKEGDLVFDIGGHVGDRVAAFRRLGANVVVLEPQPALATTLRLLYGLDESVTVVEAAVGACEGRVALRLNLANPTVSTASKGFVAAARDAPGWEDQQWTRTVDVAMTTLDALIARHGVPRFIKIDVEGFEAEALAGLGAPVPALSFEFTTIQRDVAHAAIKRCRALGYDGFAASLGESLTFVHDRSLSADEVAAWIDELADEANSGDIYAMLG